MAKNHRYDGTQARLVACMSRTEAKTMRELMASSGLARTTIELHMGRLKAGGYATMTMRKKTAFVGGIVAYQYQLTEKTYAGPV